MVTTICFIFSNAKLHIHTRIYIYIYIYVCVCVCVCVCVYVCMYLWPGHYMYVCIYGLGIPVLSVNILSLGSILPLLQIV